MGSKPGASYKLVPSLRLYKNRFQARGFIKIGSKPGALYNWVPSLRLHKKNSFINDVGQITWIPFFR